MSLRRGWAIGPGRLLHTTDGGGSWSALPTPPAGVRQVRFASSAVGYSWAAGGPLWATTDAGSTWHRGGLAQVGSVETAAGVVWAIAGDLPYPGVWRAQAGSNRWSKLGVTPNRSGTLDVHGDTAYVMGEQGAGPISPAVDIWRGTQRVRKESLPCADNSTYVPSSPLGTSTDGTLLLVCVVQIQSHAGERAYLSPDQAQDWTTTAPPPEAPSDVTAVRGRLFAWGKDLHVQVEGVWMTSLLGPPSGKGFMLVGFQDDTHGVALGSDAVLHLTQDAGRTWNVVAF